MAHLFCCGAGSIHRREALFENCLNEIEGSARPTEQQPFKFHVSEDIFTSIQLHGKRWKSVYHPRVEARMLSPWSVEAWAAQKHKYSGGTFDIMLRANPVFEKGMPWRVKLHYLATFWSYAAVFWFPILLLAPAFSLMTGHAPIDAYTLTFFAHLLPVLICNELALAVGTKGYDTYSGRCLAMGTLQIQLKALFQVARGRRPRFKPTPKRPGPECSMGLCRSKFGHDRHLGTCRNLGLGVLLLRSAKSQHLFTSRQSVLDWLQCSAFGQNRRGLHQHPSCDSTLPNKVSSH